MSKKSKAGVAGVWGAFVRGQGSPGTRPQARAMFAKGLSAKWISAKWISEGTLVPATTLLALFFAGAPSARASGDFTRLLIHRYLQMSAHPQDGGAPELFRIVEEGSLGASWLSNLRLTSEVKTTQGSFDQKVDHETPADSRTFKQRYFLDSEYASGPGAPVFYVMCGE